MTPIKERKLAYYLAGILLVVGAISYAAFPDKTPEEPVRLMFKSVSGNVLFGHQTHSAESGYGIACKECHHHPEEAEEEKDVYQSCKNCHQIPKEGESVPPVCLDCHDKSEVEDSEIIKSADAFHAQCSGCHEDFGAGPKEQECASCHVL